MARTAKAAETKTTKATIKKAAAKKVVSKTTKKVVPKTTKAVKISIEKKVRPKPEIKTYKVYFGNEKDAEGNKKDIGTYPQGKQPKQAARKAITPIFMSLLNAKKEPKKVAAIEKYLDKNKKDKKGNPIKTDKYKEEMKKYEESISKEFMDKYYLFYLIQKSPRIPREYRHYYYGMRQSINPDIKSYLTKVDPSLSEEDIKKIKEENKNLPKDKQKEIPKITIKEEDYNGKLIKDKNGNVIEIQIPHYEMRPILGKDGKPIMEPAKKKNGEVKIGKDGKVIMVKKMEKIPGKEPRWISYKYTNIVGKLTKEFYDEHKNEFNLTAEQEQELTNHFNHVRPPKIMTKRDLKKIETKKRRKEEKKAKEAAKKEAKKQKKAKEKAEKKAKEAAKKQKTSEKKAKKPAVKKTVEKKPTVKKTVEKKPAVKKTVEKKPVVKKTTEKKATEKK